MKLKANKVTLMKDEDLEEYECNIKCSLCEEVITDVRNLNNAFPLNSEPCCPTCNVNKVVPARFGRLFSTRGS